MSRLKAFVCFFLIVSFISLDLFAGPVDLKPEAPAFLSGVNFILTFLSANIQSQSIAFIAWIVSLSLIMQSLARGIAELLGLFANKTKTNIDNKLMMFFSDVARFLGTIIAWFGVGSLPKSLR
jgi:hypothetical protein